MIYPRTIRDFGVFIDGTSYAGNAIMAKLPDVKIQTAAHRGAGMDGPVAIDMGLEAMTAEVTVKEWTADLLKLIGTRRRMVLRPAAMGEQDFAATAYIATLGGRWSSMAPGELKPGDDVPMVLGLEVDYFRLEAETDEICEIDVQAGIRKIGGVDQLADKRRAMGL